MSTHIRTLIDDEGNIFYPLTTSEAVANGLIVDLSDITSGSTYSSLSAALSALPETYRKGGMELRYINSDGEYVQYRYTGTAITGNPNPFMDASNWTQGNVFASGESIDGISIDSKPKDGSNSLVSGGGIFDEIMLSAGAFDLTEYNSGTTYSGLSEALSAMSISELSDYRRGGMSIRFVQTGDNKYVQYMYTGTETTGSPNPFLNADKWEKLNLEVEMYSVMQQIGNIGAILDELNGESEVTNE